MMVSCNSQNKHTLETEIETFEKFDNVAGFDMLRMMCFLR